MGLKQLPRFPLAAIPTPLMRAGRLERALVSPPLFVKRDDLTGFALAGNKARKLEFLLADALGRESDVVVTGGGPGSNHCRGAAAAAKVAGLACVLVMYGDEPRPVPANLEFIRGFGADVRFTGDPDRGSVDAGIEQVAASLQVEGRNPYVLPRGGATPLGAAAYAHAAEEMARQLAAAEVERATVVVAAGSCGTQAGLVAGAVAGARPWRVVGASVSRPVAHCLERVLSLAGGAAALLDASPPEKRHVEVIDARGPGYGKASPEGAEAARLAAETEGLVLDPVFTAKSMSALIRLVRGGLSDPVVFVHTGGEVAAVQERIASGGKERSHARH